MIREQLLSAYLFEEGQELEQELLVKRNTEPTYAEHTNHPDLFRYSDELLTPTENGWFSYEGYTGEVKRLPKKPYTGQLFLLVDGGTYSAAADLALKVKLSERGLILGEETGGVAGGSNSGVAMRLKLPNTKGTVLIPLVAAHYDLHGRAEASEGVIPDIPVMFSPEDLERGFDAEVFYIERFLK